jgi:hypothetical protein
MKTQIAVASGILLSALVGTVATVPAHALSMKDCSTKYQAAKDAGTLKGQTWNEFRKAECGGEAAEGPATSAPPPTSPASAPASTPAPAPASTKPPKTGSPGRDAMIARERACGKEWKEAKAAGKTTGIKWPQYWHECDQRKKASGM